MIFNGLEMNNHSLSLPMGLSCLAFNQRLLAESIMITSL